MALVGAGVLDYVMCGGGLFGGDSFGDGLCGDTRKITDRAAINRCPQKVRKNCHTPAVIAGFPAEIMAADVITCL